MAAAHAAKASAARNIPLLVGSAFSAVFGFIFMSQAGPAGFFALALFALFAFVPVIGIATTAGFQVGKLAQKGAGVRALYWLTAIPGLLIGSIFLIALAALGIWGQREASIERDAEAIARGIRRSGS